MTAVGRDRPPPVLPRGLRWVRDNPMFISALTVNMGPPPAEFNARRYVTEITDGLVPELQKRGLVRSEYTTTMLRDHLREF